MNSDHFHNLLDFGQGLLIFRNLAPFWLSEMVNCGGFGIFCRTHGKDGLKIGVLMYPDHFWNWLHLAMVCFFLVVTPILLSETDQWAVSRHFHDNVWEEWTQICQVHLYLLISPEMKNVNLSTWLLPGYRARVSLATVFDNKSVLYFDSNVGSRVDLTPYKRRTNYLTNVVWCHMASRCQLSRYWSSLNIFSVT